MLILCHVSFFEFFHCMSTIRVEIKPSLYYYYWYYYYYYLLLLLEQMIYSMKRKNDL